MPKTTPEYCPATLPSLEFLSHVDLGIETLQDCDATACIFHDASTLNMANASSTTKTFLMACGQAVMEHLEHDHALALGRTAFMCNTAVPGGRLLIVPTGPLLRDQDDVRRYGEAATQAIRRLKAAGTVRRPLILLQRPPFSRMEETTQREFGHYIEVAMLGAIAEVYEALEAREALPELQEWRIEVVRFALVGMPEEDSQVRREDLLRDGRLVEFVNAVEIGRCLARDIGGADPERMTAIRAAETISAFFLALPHIKVSIIEDQKTLRGEYPLLAAVSRASEHVARHAPRVVHLEYRSPEQNAVERELFMVGKGITYDTGGADIKAGGAMMGMSRDKCGAAALAGLMATCALLKPRNLNLTIALAFVRNSVGPDSYVSDEIIRSRAGVRVRVGNTDAEGRMVMADLLAYMKERALQLSHPRKAHLFTCATLTGHVRRAYGPYAAALDNGPARLLGMGQALKKASQLIGDCFEVSTVRREDYAFVAATSNREDLVQANSLPSAMTPRGHQYPMAFLCIASGLDKHGLDSPPNQRLSYTHMDIAAVAEENGMVLGRTTGSPIPALSTLFFYHRADGENGDLFK